MVLNLGPHIPGIMGEIFKMIPGIMGEIFIMIPGIMDEILISVIQICENVHWETKAFKSAHLLESKDQDGAKDDALGKPNQVAGDFGARFLSTLFTAC